MKCPYGDTERCPHGVKLKRCIKCIHPPAHDCREAIALYNKPCFFASQGCKEPPVTRARFCYHYTEQYGPNTLFQGMECGSLRPVCKEHAKPPEYEGD